MAINLSGWLALSRAEHAAFVIVGVAAGAAIASKSIAPMQLLLGIGPALITLAAFIFNDYFDLPSDKANRRKERPLVSGVVKMNEALIAFCALYLLGLLLSYLISPSAFIVALSFAVLSALYTLFLKKIPFVGNLYIASTMAIPFIYGSYASCGTAQCEVSPLILVLASIAFITGVGRELLISLRDVEGDKKIGATTLPMLIGPKSTVLFASLLIGIAVLLSALPMMWLGFSIPYAIFVACCDALLIYVVALVQADHSVGALKLARNYTLYAMGLGLIAFLSLAL